MNSSNIITNTSATSTSADVSNGHAHTHMHVTSAAKTKASHTDEVVKEFVKNNNDDTNANAIHASASTLLVQSDTPHANGSTYNDVKQGDIPSSTSTSTSDAVQSKHDM